MRIEFRDTAGTQDPVVPRQTAMRDARSRKVPVLPVLFLIFVVAVAGAGLYFVSRAGDIYTYGLVMSELQTVQAPFQGRVEALAAKRGDRVEADAALFRFVPVPAEAEIAARAMVLEALERARAAEAEARAIAESQARKEIERLEAQWKDESAERAHNLARAEVEVEKLREFLASKTERLARVRQLYNMDAAVNADVLAAENEVALARHELRQAELDRDDAAARQTSSRAELEKAQLALEAIREQGEAGELDIEMAQVKHAFAAAEVPPLTFKALFDGVVMQVNAVNGGLVEAGLPLMTVASTERVWVDAYIPPGRYSRLEPGAEVLVYVAGNSEPVEGRLAAETASASPVPELLGDQLPRTKIGLYARIELDPNIEAGLVPGTEVRVVVPGKRPW